jgi:hypothetical protein
MIRLALPFCLVLSAATAHADWKHSAEECGALVAAQTVPRCGSCAALWPQISKCAAEAEGVEPARAEACINRVNTDDWSQPMYFDRVAEVFSCLSK